MSAFDVTLNVQNLGIQPIDSGDGKAYDAHVVLGLAQQMPVGDGSQVFAIPLGTVRFPLSRENVEQLIVQLQAACDTMEDRPKPSNLQIARDLTGVDAVKDSLDGLRG